MLFIFKLTWPTEKDVFNITLVSTPSRQAPYLMTKPTPIPRSIPPNTVASSTSWVTTPTFLKTSNNNENTTMAKEAWIRKFLPKCLNPNNRNGTFITTIKILKFIFVKKLSIMDIPVILPSIILFGIGNTSKAKAANNVPMVINI